MAFDRPLEADRVDDLGLLSSFVRAPIVGPIMWALGGRMAKILDEEERQMTVDSPSSIIDLVSLTDDGENSSLSSFDTAVEDDPHPDFSNDSCAILHNDAKSPIDFDFALASAISEMRENIPPPPLSLASDVSLVSDASLEQKHCHCNDGSSSDLSSNTKPPQHRFAQHKSLKQGKKMSWSDESGRSLVVYLDANSSPQPCALDMHHRLKTQPIKSAMKRSSSLRSGNMSLPSATACSSSSSMTSSATPEDHINPSKNVPSGIVGGSDSRNGGSVMMPRGGGMLPPSGPGVQGASSGGSVSPQWGWYISTTPPSPDKYYAPRRNGKKKTSNSRDSGPEQVKKTEDIQQDKCLEENPYPAPVFKRNAPGARGAVCGKTATMGWPTVPL